MSFVEDLDAAELRVDDWQAELAKRARRARMLADEVQQLTVDASVADGVVTATVNQGGQLIRLTIREKAREWPADRIAAAVLAAQGAAQRALARHVRELAAEAGFERGA